MDGQKNSQPNDRGEKRLLILALLATALLAAVVGTLAWLRYSRSLQTMTTVHVPVLYLAGADGSSTIDIDMSDIDVIHETEEYYAFSVVSKSKDGSTDNYILQLAHTTNLPFNYAVYKPTDTIPGVITDTNRGDEVIMTQLTQEIDKNEKTGTLYDTYGDYENIHPAADPIYYQSAPQTIASNSRIDYYILRVWWNAGSITNNKETDMVYLSVGAAPNNDVGGST